KEVLLCAAPSVVIVLARLWARDHEHRAERALLAMATALSVTMALAGFATADGASDDAAYLFVVPVGMALFAPWRPVRTFVLGVLSLLAIAGAVTAGITTLPIPLWKVAELVVLATAAAALAN